MEKNYEKLPKRLLNASLKKMQILLCICLVMTLKIAAQTTGISVSGKVLDGDKKPLTNVSVTLKGTNTGTNTDAEGSFSIKVPNTNSVLVFSFVGYDSKEITVGNSTTINVELATSVNDLNDVVVIGYGTAKRKDLTGSVFSVKANDIVRMPTHNAIEAIQGRVPGIDLTRSSGAAGSGINIRVRGNRTISGNNEPLFIIDGFQVAPNVNKNDYSNNAFADINPNDIESIDVLKDASATAIYGAQGANGVIIITTKKGASGKAKVNYDGFYGINGYAAYPKMRTGEDYIQLRREAYKNTGPTTPPEWTSPADDSKMFTADEWDAIQRNEWVDWYDLLAQVGQQQSHNVSIRAGTDKTKAFLSAGYFKEEGMLRGNIFERFTLRTNIEQTLNSWAKVGLNMQLTLNDNDRRTDPLGLANQTSPIAKAYDDNGNIRLFPVYGDASIISPLADDRGDTVYKNNMVNTRIMGNGFVELKLAKGLIFKSTFGGHIGYRRQGIYQAATSIAQRLTRQTISQQNVGTFRNLNFDNILTYNKEFGDHSLTATAIHSYISEDKEGLDAMGYSQLLSSQYFYNLGASSSATVRPISSLYEGWTNLAFAGRLNYSYKGRYLLALTYRKDGASRLSEGKKWDDFPSISAAWNISDEKFMENVSFIDNLKLRASHGVTGNYGIEPYSTQSTLNAFNTLAFGEIPQTYYYFNQYVGNKNVTWEKSTTTNIGLDFALLKGRLTGSVEVYNTNTDGLLYARQFPRSSGSISNGVMLQIFENIGASNNKGLEFSLNAQVVKNKNFTWTSTATFTHNKEKITKLVDGKNILNGTDPENKSLIIGSPINSFWTFNKLGIWQTDEAAKAATVTFGNTPYRPGDIKVEDLNGDNIIDPNNDRKVIGSAVPKFVLGWQNSVSYKDFDLGVYMFVRYGQMINATFMSRYNPSGMGNGPAEFNYWTPENPSNDFPRPTKGGQFINYAAYQSMTYIDGSFLKLKTMTLGYTLPQAITKKIHAEKIRFYVTANNCFTFSKSHLLRNYDPERGGEQGEPLMRQVIFGLNLGL